MPRPLSRLRTWPYTSDLDDFGSISSLALLAARPSIIYENDPLRSNYVLELAIMDMQAASIAEPTTI